jgi:hypothetical protein
MEALRNLLRKTWALDPNVKIWVEGNPDELIIDDEVERKSDDGIVYMDRDGRQYITVNGIELPVF